MQNKETPFEFNKFVYQVIFHEFSRENTMWVILKLIRQEDEIIVS